MDSDALYAAFSAYPRRPEIAGCPCCSDPEDHALLQNGPLAVMPAEVLAEFSFSAMLSWGEAVDVKHFLPRILELAAEGQPFPGLEFWLIQDRLERAGFAAWPAAERDAVGAFLCAVASERHVDALVECIAALGVSIAPVLSAWEKDPVPFVEYLLALEGDVHPALAMWLRAPERLVALEALLAEYASTPDGPVIAQAIETLKALTAR